jgi:hypothetical protein
MDDHAETAKAMPDEPPRPLSVIEEQLRDLAHVIEAACEYGTPDASSRFGMESLRNHERELLDEKHAAEFLDSGREAELELEQDAACLEGTPVEPFVRLVANAVAEIQAVRRTESPSIGRDLRAQHALQVLAVRRRPPNESDLLIIGVRAAEAMAEVCAALDPTTPSSYSAYLLCRPHVRVSYQRLLELMATLKVGLVVRTRARPRGVRLTPEQARGRLEWVALQQPTEKTIEPTDAVDQPRQQSQTAPPPRRIPRVSREP